MQILAASGIGKSFPGVQALHNVSLTLNMGEVLAVLGENGAGKSTLMKILAGIQRPSAGYIEVNNERVSIESPKEAMKLGIALIHQELNLCDNLTIAENIYLGREPQSHGLINKRALNDQAKNWLNRIGLNIDPRTALSQLSIGHSQLVEIAKVLSTNARIIIMDEPTSSLSNDESERLFQVINELRNDGVSIIYISHRLSEIIRISDRALVLRDGQNSGLLEGNHITREKMISAMVGRSIDQYYPRTQREPGNEILRVENLVTQAHPQKKINLIVNQHEIVGIAGLIGAGRTEFLETLFGISPSSSGQIFINQQETAFDTPESAINAGVALVPENRKKQGLILGMNICQNISLSQLRKWSLFRSIINFKQEFSGATQAMDQLSIRATGVYQMTSLLSGGNQQKVAIAKWLATNPKLLLLDEPTRGVDVGAKQDIYHIMRSLVDKGMTILFASSELEELIGVADRVVVMYQGDISGQLDRDNISEKAIMELATGKAA
tara:strand:+ start:824 stop:2314 length:1491 start_codon:yes stop_codon:yes gene_type:complete